MPLVENPEEFLAAGIGVADIIERDGELQSSKNAVPSASAARTIYDRMRKAHQKRCAAFAKIQGMIDGNPPYSRMSLARGGHQHMSNVNWRDGESIYESLALAYWSLFNDVQYVAEFTTGIGDPIQNPHFGRIVSEEFDAIIRRWDEFYDLMDQHQGDFIKFGHSFVFWPDERNWQFEVADVAQVLVPERTKNSTNQINVCCIEHTMSAQELWDIAEGEGSVKWNIPVVRQILLHCAQIKDKDQYSGDLFIELQRQIRNGDTTLDQIYNDDISLVSIYARELDGGVSRGVFHADVVTQPLGAESDWAFFSDRHYDSMAQALMLFTFTPGEKFIHGNKGIGQKIFNTIEGVTQIDNSLMDSVRRSSTVLVKTRAGRNKDLRQIQFNHGGFVDIGEAEFIQNLMGANLNSNVEAAKYFRYKLELNNNISGSSMSTPDGRPRTLGEIRMQTTKEARVQKNRIAHYYRQLDRLFREVVRKMLLSKSSYPGYDLVELWKDRCEKRGVPSEFFELNKQNEGQNGLPEHLDVRATRASGSGSQVADQIEMQTMMTLLPTFGERGRRNVLRDFVAANRGFRYIDRYLPDEDETGQPTSEDTLSSIENNQLEKGEMVVVSPDNVHAVHAPRHINRLDQLSQAFNDSVEQAAMSGSENPWLEAEGYGQYSLEEVDIAFQTIGPHTVRHLFFLQQDPTRKELAQSLVAKWAILANFGDKIANNAQQHRQKQIRDLRKQQEELAKLDMEERVKMREVEIDANVKLAKLRLDHARASQRDQLKFLLDREKIQNEKQIKRTQAMLKAAQPTDGGEQQGGGE